MNPYTTHGFTGVGRPASTYLDQFWAKTGYGLDLLRVMDDRNGWREKVMETHAVSMT